MANPCRLCRSFANSTESKRAYELLENPSSQIHLASLLAPHQQQTARRMAAESVVLLAHSYKVGPEPPPPPHV